VGLGDTLQKQLSRLTAATVVTRFYEPHLKVLKLSKEQIDQQDLDELENSLDVVNDAIANHDSYPKLRLKYVSEAGLVIVKDDSEATLTATILPSLLTAKGQILERIRVLTPREKISNLSELVEKVSDDEVRKALQQEIQDLKAQAQSLNAQEEQTKAAAAEEQSRQQAAFEIEIRRFKERSRVYRSFLERESVATIVGALLLLILGATHIIAMFTGTATSDILNNSFLIILGYFFGQTVSKRAESVSE
jgi:hypothetical protein